MAGVTQVNPGRNLSATIKQGFELMRGRDLPNYTLYFLDPTKKYGKGQYQNFFVEHLKIGRASDCDISYGEDFRSVSRHQASISIVDKNFILRHNPKASNRTYVNEKSIVMHHLQNGDEIQLSESGPKIRFNISELETSTMGLTSRMTLWGRQVLRPYRRAVTLLTLLLLITIAGVIWGIGITNERVAEVENVVQDVGETIVDIAATIDTTEAQHAATVQRLEDQLWILRDQYDKSEESNKKRVQVLIDQIQKIKKEKEEELDIMRNQGYGSRNSVVNNNLSETEVAAILPSSDIYIIRAKNIEIPMSEDYNVRGISISGKDFVLEESALWTGTGFLTEQGFITARHVIQPWRFSQFLAKDDIFYKMNILESYLGLDVDVAFEAEDQQGNSIAFKYMDFRGGDSGDRRHPYPKDAKPEERVSIQIADEYATDWAYMTSTRKGKIKYDSTIPGKLLPGDKLYCFGYSQGEKIQSGGTPTPYFGTMTVSKIVQGDSLIYTNNRSFTSGNSGGPVFAIIGDQPVVVGIVSASLDNQGIIVPISQIY